jgi:hypothetical protein
MRPADTRKEKWIGRVIGRWPGSWVCALGGDKVPPSACLAAGPPRVSPGPKPPNRVALKAREGRAGTNCDGERKETTIIKGVGPSGRPTVLTHGAPSPLEPASSARLLLAIKELPGACEALTCSGRQAGRVCCLSAIGPAEAPQSVDASVSTTPAAGTDDLKGIVGPEQRCAPPMTERLMLRRTVREAGESARSASH